MKTSPNILESCDIPGVKIWKLERFDDERGWLLELFRRDQLSSEQFPAMGYLSLTLPGIKRGPHEHHYQTDLFFFVTGTLLLRLTDNTELTNKAYALEVGKDNPVGVLVPPGIVHSYENIGDSSALVINCPNRLYRGEGGQSEIDEIRHEGKGFFE